MKKVLNFLLKIALTCSTLVGTLTALNLPTFDDCFGEYAYSENPNGKIFRDLYTVYQDEYTLKEAYLIPKLVHFIWLGSPLPESCEKIIDSWIQLHPDWTVKLWTDADVNSFSLENHRAFKRASNFGEKSDIFRYEILYRYGGVYVDTDFECLKPFDELHRSCEFYAGIQYCNTCLLNGIIGAKAGHPILRECIKKLRVGPGDHDGFRIMDYTGPYHFTRMVVAHLSSNPSAPIVCLPPTILFPLPGISKDLMLNRDEFKEMFVKPESLAIHYWACSWVPKEEPRSDTKKQKKKSAK